MNFPLAHLGFSSPSDREHRLLNMSTEAPDDRLPITRTIDNVVAGALKLVGGFVDPDAKRRKETQENLRSSTAWLMAFESTDAFTSPPLDRATLNNRALMPIDILKTMTEAQRVDVFVEFTENILSARAAAADIKALRDAFALAPALRAKAMQPVVRKLVGASRIILGISIVADPTTPDAVLARGAYRELYGDLTEREGVRMGVVYADYVQAVRLIRGRTGATPVSEANLRTPKFLVEQLTLIRNERPARLLGWLQTENPAEVERVLKQLGEFRAKQENEESNQKLDTVQELGKIQLEQKQEAERKGRTVIDNFNMMEPWQQYAVIGLGLYAMYRMWNSKSIIARGIPVALLGTYLYLRLVSGDQNAIVTMTNRGDTVLKAVRDFGRDALRLRGHLDTIENQDLDRLAALGAFFRKVGLDIDRRAAPLICTMGVKAKHFGGDVYRAELDGAGNIRYNFFAPLGSAFANEAMGEARRRRYDVEELQKTWFSNAPRIAQGLGPIFFHIAARQFPSEAKVVEEARLKSGRFGGRYDDIADPEVKRKYVDLVNRGRLLVSTSPAYREKSLYQVVGELMTEDTERVVRPDTAQRIPDVRALDRRSAEFGPTGLLALRNSPLQPNAAAERKLAVARIRGDYDQFLNNCENHHGLINAEARKEIRARFELIAEDGTKSLREILLAVERLKYLTLVAAFSAPSPPLSGDIAVRGFLSQLDGGSVIENIINFPGGILNALNRSVLTVSSGFVQVENLANIEAMLAERAGGPRSLNGAGFKRLQDETARYRKFFGEMREARPLLIFTDASTRRRTAERMAKLLPESVRTSLGEARAAEAVFGILNHVDPDHNGRINALERFFAQKCATSLALAMLTTHAADGTHALDAISDRAVTPIEMDNLESEWSHTFIALVGGDRVSPMNGFWGRMEAIDAVHAVTSTVPAGEKERKAFYATFVTEKVTALTGADRSSAGPAMIREVTALTRAYLWVRPGSEASRTLATAEMLGKMFGGTVEGWVKMLGAEETMKKLLAEPAIKAVIDAFAVPPHTDDMGIRARVVAIAEAFAEAWETRGSPADRKTLRADNPAFSVENQRLVLDALRILGVTGAIVARIEHIVTSNLEDEKKKAEMVKKLEDGVKKIGAGEKIASEAIDKLSEAKTKAAMKKLSDELTAKAEKLKKDIADTIKAKTDAEEILKKGADPAAEKNLTEAMKKIAELEGASMKKFEADVKEVLDKIRKEHIAEGRKFVEEHVKAVEGRIAAVVKVRGDLLAHSVVFVASVEALAKAGGGAGWVKPVQEQLKSSAASAKALQGHIETLDKNRGALEEAMKKLGADPAALKTVRDNIATMQTTMTRIEGEIGNLQKQSADFRAVLAGAVKAGAPAAEVKAVTDAIGVTEASIKTLQGEMNGIRADQKLLQERLTKLGL